MVEQVVATSGSNGLQLVVGQRASEPAAGGGQGVEEAIVGIVHLIDPKDSAQTTCIEAGIVSHERNQRAIGEAGLDVLLDLFPNVGKDGGIVGISRRKSMHALAEILVVIGFGMNEAVKRICHFPILHDDDAYRTHAAWLFVGGLEVYGNEVSEHLLEFDSEHL